MPSTSAKKTTNVRELKTICDHPFANGWETDRVGIPQLDPHLRTSWTGHRASLPAMTLFAGSRIATATRMKAALSSRSVLH
jgi:hypothetical protein